MNFTVKKNKTTKRLKSKSSKPSTDSNYNPRTRFLEVLNEFRIDSYNIPRPLRSHQGWNQVNISDSDCVFGAFALLDVPHDSFRNNIKESKGWLIGPHLYIDDWTLTFGTGRLEHRLANNPWLLITDSPTQLAIAILRSKCRYGTPSEEKISKLALKQLKLELLIPKEASKRRSKDINLRYYDNNPIYLKAAVSFYEYIITKYCNNDTNKAFNLIFNKQMPHEITDDESGATTINKALSFISYEVNVEFSTLRRKFYDSKNGLNNEIKEIKLYEYPDFIDSIINPKKTDKKTLKEYKKTLKQISLHFKQPLLY